MASCVHVFCDDLFGIVGDLLGFQVEETQLGFLEGNLIRVSCGETLLGFSLEILSVRLCVIP